MVDRGTRGQKGGPEGRQGTEGRNGDQRAGRGIVDGRQEYQSMDRVLGGMNWTHTISDTCPYFGNHEHISSSR